MALTIGVDSFVSVADADTYWQNNSGGDNWASAMTPDKEKALRMASQYIDKQYTWIGYHPGSVDQLLSWPRLNAIDDQGRFRNSSEVPKEVKDATAWMAEQALAGQLLDAKDRGGDISRLKAGPVEIEYGEQAPSQPSFDYVDLLLSGLTTGGKGVTPMHKG